MSGTGFNGNVGIVPPPLRADGRRNYAAVLAAAGVAFRRDGANASLEGIARDAGVSIGTLYRRFPTREWLIATVAQDSLVSLIALAGSADGATGSAGQIRAFITAAVEHCSVFDGLSEHLSIGLKDQDSPFYAACHLLLEASGELLRRAQRDGVVRPDVSVDDVWNVILAGAWLRQAPGATSASLESFLHIALTGIAVTA